jgi:hypothetical protein
VPLQSIADSSLKNRLANFLYVVRCEGLIVEQHMAWGDRRNLPSRSAVSAEMERFPSTLSITRGNETLISFATG